MPEYLTFCWALHILKLFLTFSYSQPKISCILHSYKKVCTYFCCLFCTGEHWFAPLPGGHCCFALCHRLDLPLSYLSTLDLEVFLFLLMFFWYSSPNLALAVNVFCKSGKQTIHIRANKQRTYYFFWFAYLHLYILLDCKIGSDIQSVL